MINTLVNVEDYPSEKFTLHITTPARIIAMASRNHQCHRRHTVMSEMESADEDFEDVTETVEELRARLAHLKKMMQQESGNTLGDIAAKKKKLSWDFIDGNILSAAFCLALVVVISVSFYAFFHLYFAILKKFPSRHTEL